MNREHIEKVEHIEGNNYKVNNQINIVMDLKNGKISDYLDSALTANVFRAVKDGFIEVAEWVEPVATIKQQIQELKQDRDSALNSNAVEINGYTFEARPKDLANIQMGIEKGETIWPDENDFMVDVTVADLTELMTTGINQGETIWDEYKQAVKALQS